jgi:hypothetical protein
MSANEPRSDPSNPDSAVLDAEGLAALLCISVATILTQRSRTPEKLPPPFLLRPLRWRRSTVFRWMDHQEQKEDERAKNHGARGGDTSTERHKAGASGLKGALGPARGRTASLQTRRTYRIPFLTRHYGVTSAMARLSI